MALFEDLKRLAQDAIADVGNTYRAVLLQHTGWVAPRPESGIGTPSPEDDGPPLFGSRRVIEIAAPSYDRNKPLKSIGVDI